MKVKDTPSYSLGSRPKDAKKYVTPAPGAYESCDTRKYKSQPPSYSLSIRYPVPSDTTLKPGPGAYTPEKVERVLMSCFDSKFRNHTNPTHSYLHVQTNTKANMPQYSFGTRHSRYMFGARPLPGEETRPLPY